MKRTYNFLLYILFIFIPFSNLFAQDILVKGTIKDSKNKPVISASIMIKGTQRGTITDDNGAFTLKIEKDEKITLIITSIGFFKKEVFVGINNQSVLGMHIQLEEKVEELNDIIVTGVFDKRKRIESSIALTTLDNKTLDRIVPNTALELLRLVPGVYTNTSRGEIYNTIVVRGMILGDYVSIQEDGLPVISATGQFTADQFLRADIGIGRIEAVRGGPASILGVNAPGGIFNYISKTGTSKFEGEVRTRLGLEGNGKNPYYRMEAGFGGPVSKKDSSLTYYVGGHYRYAKR